MELDNDIRTYVTGTPPPPLNSDQLNYLIWRYLQEAGYAEAAVKLQRDWNLDPQSLPFVKHIKGRALISLVQRGLRYYHLSKTIDKDGQASIPLQPSMFFFGPESDRRTSSSLAPNRGVDDQSGLGAQAPSLKAAASGVRKHARESGPNGALDPIGQPAPKRSRKNASTTNGVERNPDQTVQHALPPAASMTDESDMEIDRVNGYSYQQAGRAASAAPDQAPLPVKSPSPANAELEGDIDMATTADQEVAMSGADDGVDGREPQDLERMMEQATPIFTLTNGHSVGVQITPAKVADLKPETRILGVADGQHVTQILWRPRDSTLLAVAGEHFCGAWRVSNQTLRAETPQLPYTPLIDPSANTLVTAVAWEPGGSLLAVGTISDLSGYLRIYEGNELVLEEALIAAHKMIVSLRWQTIGARLAGFTCDKDSSSLLLWDLSASQDSPVSPSLAIPEAIYDIDWARHGNTNIICAAGDGVVYQCLAFPDLTVQRKWTSVSEADDTWSFVRCSWASEDVTVVIAAASNSANLWLPAQDFLRHGVHDAAITGLEIRPVYLLHPEKASVHEFATSSLDNAIKVWRFDNRTHELEVMMKIYMGLSTPVVALSYSPDGYYIAGAGYDHVRIWNADKGGQAVAQWDNDQSAAAVGVKHSQNTANGAVATADRESPDPEHSLSWDSDSKKLAYGLRNQVALINFQR